MKNVIKLSRNEADERTYADYNCPACRTTHRLIVAGPGAWGWNGSLEKPTFTPSLLGTSGHYMAAWKGPECWCTYKKDSTPPFGCYRCHSYITDGNILFLDDCSHEMRGKTVPLAQFEAEQQLCPTDEPKI